MCEILPGLTPRFFSKAARENLGEEGLGSRLIMGQYFTDMLEDF